MGEKTEKVTDVDLGEDFNLSSEQLTNTVQMLLNGAGKFTNEKEVVEFFNATAFVSIAVLRGVMGDDYVKGWLIGELKTESPMIISLHKKETKLDA